MIRFSFSSFYMSLLFSNIMILLLFISFHNQKITVKLGLPILSSGLFITILRMVLPFEFLFLSNNVYFPEFISKYISSFQSPCFIWDRFSVWSFVKIIWCSGIFILIAYFWKREKNFSKKIKLESKKLPDTDPACRILRQIQKEIPKASNIEIRTLSSLHMPVIYGLRTPYILLPEDLVLSDNQLYYVLRHEVSHYLHHDLILKLAVKILCIIYWWNPLCKFLLKKTDNILEMRVDQVIAKQPNQKAEYLECLLFIAAHMEHRDNSIQAVNTIAFCDEYSVTLMQRFKMLIDDRTSSHQKKYHYIFLFFLTTLFFLSFFYIFEADYDDTKNSIGVITPDKSNSYFVERKDGKYDFYLYGEYSGTEDSLEYYPYDLPIYKEE